MFTTFYMAMPRHVSFPNYEKCYPKRLKKIFQSNICYKTYENFIPHMQRAVVGNIPPEVIKLLSDKNRGENIKQFQEALSDVSEYLRGFYKRNNKTIGFNLSRLNLSELQNLEDKASEIFNKKVSGLFKKPVKTMFSYEDCGAFADVYKMSLQDEIGNKIMHDKAMKIYYDIELPERYKSTKHAHNNYAEANFWIFLKNILGHKMDETQFTKHYISDLKSGYSMTEFIDDDISPTTRFFHLTEILKIQNFDFLNNFPIGCKLYDAGGYEKLAHFIDDKVTLRHYKKLFYKHWQHDVQPYVEHLSEQIKNTRFPHRDKIQKALDIFKSEYGWR